MLLDDGIIIQADNIKVLKSLPNDSIDLIYIDPPFNTGKIQKYVRLKTKKSPGGVRTGFAGNKYEVGRISTMQFNDSFGDEYLNFLSERLEESHRILAPHGSIYVHLDYREVHYCKILLDQIFGRECFLNEIIWAYDYGARTTKKWPTKHDNILLYVKNPKKYIFNYEDIDRIQYMAPNLVGPEKAKKGKTPTDTWWHTIVPTNSRERTGYPTQKPIGIIERIIRASSNKGQIVLDFFAGSGTTGIAAIKLNRRFILVDNNPDAIMVMKTRFRECLNVRWEVIENDPPTGKIQPPREL